jgi:peroxiredoxin
MSTNTIQIGQKAPEFSLYDSEKQKVNLIDYKGKNVILLFFPQAFTGTCTKELCSTRDNITLYNQANAQVFAISVDSVFTLGKYKEEQHLNFPLLSDFNKEVSAAYGSLYDNFVFDMKGVSKRSAFVIDKEGTVRYAEVLESAGDLPDFTAIQKTLSEFN